MGPSTGWRNCPYAIVVLARQVRACRSYTICMLCNMSILSFRQLCCQLPVPRHLCRVCGARHVHTYVRQGHAQRSPVFLGQTARTRGRSTSRWQQCTAGAADSAIDAGVASQERRAGSIANVAEARQGPSFQDAIAALQAYWSSNGCAVCLPHNTEVWLSC